MTYLRNKEGMFRKSLFIPLGLVFVLVGGITLGFIHQSFASTVEYRTVEVEKIVKDESPTPVLLRIAKCESGGSHTDKNGQVLISKTQDVGIYQINVPIWGKKATELGYNLVIEVDNVKMARWLYENYGSEPWIHSKKCWNG